MPVRCMTEPDPHRGHLPVDVRGPTMSRGGQMSEPAGPATVREIKVFISSPGDVNDERERLMSVITKLDVRLGSAARLRAINWPDYFYKADSTFQQQIEQAASCDIVISIFWSKLGTELPPEFAERLPDGRPYPSGTAYEVLTALEAA